MGICPSTITRWKHHPTHRRGQEKLAVCRLRTGWQTGGRYSNADWNRQTEQPGPLCLAQGYSGEIANLAKLQIGRIASAGRSSDNRQPTPHRCFPNPIGVTGLVAYRTLTPDLPAHGLTCLAIRFDFIPVPLRAPRLTSSSNASPILPLDWMFGFAYHLSWWMVSLVGFRR